MPIKVVSFRLPEDEYRRLQAEAKKQQRSVGAQIRWLLSASGKPSKGEA